MNMLADLNALRTETTMAAARIAAIETSQEAASAPKLRKPSQDELDELKRLWESGLTARRIGEITGRTRNSVLGLVHRYGFASRVQVKNARVPAAPKKRKRKTILASVEIRETTCVSEAQSTTEDAVFAVCPGQPAPNSKLLKLGELKANSCRYGLGEPGDESFRFCGAKTRNVGESWCSFHRGVVYAPERTAAKARVAREAAE